MNKVSAQFIYDTIPQSIDCECARCQMLEVKIEQLQNRMIGWNETESEIAKNAVDEFMRQVINNQFYSKSSLLDFYRNYAKGVKDE